MALITKETEIFYAYKYFLNAAAPASLEGFVIGVASQVQGAISQFGATLKIYYSTRVLSDMHFSP